ncbi:MAG: dihydrodipicolinate synthase family protein [Rhodospirillales bacterium]|nr:dihydrodipicolinate synthase family protein [Rhodospirillales bacterium]
MTDKIYRGIWPVVPTPFHDDGSIDMEGQKRVLDCMIDQGSDGLCILANYSEQFVLSDAERKTLTELCFKHVAGRVPVMVTCSHFSTQIVEDRCRHAAALGAAIIMLMPPYHGASLHAGEAALVEHYQRAADAAGIPIMVQDAPLAGVQMSVPLLARMAREIPLLQYFKIEMPQTAAKLKALIAAGGEHIVGPFDGEEAITLLADLQAGATGTMSSALLTDLIKPVVDRFAAGDHAAAEAQYNRILPLINFENRQCGFRACKTAMKYGGVIKSDFVRHPTAALAPATADELIRIAKTLNPLVLSWGK